jgi:hypothetical protein
VQVDAHATGGHFSHEFGRALDVAVCVDLHVAAMSRFDEQQGVGLRFIVQVQTDGGIVAKIHVWGTGDVLK